MKVSRKILGCAVGVLAATALATTPASAAFPDFTGCPTTGVVGCLDIQSRGGSMTIKRTTVPIGESLEIRGGITETGVWVPPRGTTGLFSRPINVPGGLLGIDFPIPGNTVQAITQLAGPTSSVRIAPGDLFVSMPVKLKLDNPILGPWCSIGTNDNPARLNLTVGTTNPPAPNRPISGRLGTISVVGSDLVIRGNTNVDNSFAVPEADNCGLTLGLIDLLVNAKLSLPSAAGNNTLIIDNDVAIRE